MASSITLKSSSYDGRYLKLVCTQTSNGGAENTSTINWTLSAVGGSESYYSTGPTTVVINGTTVYSKARVSWSSKTFPASTGSVSGEIIVSHTTDGTKTINVSLSTVIYNSADNVATYSDKWELDAIARYGTSVQSLNSKTETTIKMNWSSDNTVDYLWYSKDNGSNWTGVNVADGKSGTYTISGLTANTTYKIKTRIRRKDSQLTTDSSALSIATYNYPYCTSSPNFVLGNEVTLKFYNPLSRAFKFYIIGNGTQIDVEYDCSSTEYTGLTSTNTTVPYLYATIPNDTSAKYKVKVVYGDSTITRNNGNTYSINESECLPTFTSFDYRDTNDLITAITGNNQVLVNGYSTLSVEIPLADKMITKNSATPKNYIASIDTLSKTIDYVVDDTGGNLGVVKSAGTKRLNVRAYDSRGLSTLVYKDVVVYDYSKPVINVTATRLNNFEAQTTIKVSGQYSTLNIDGTDKNSIDGVSYRYRETDGEWTDWKIINTTITAGKFTCSDVILSLDNTKAFEIQIYVIDYIDSDIVRASVDVGQAIFFISTNKKACYINGIEVPTFDSVYPVGSVYCSSTNTDPATTFGGTWELVDKGFKSTQTSITQSATNYLSVFEVVSIRTDKTVRFRIRLTNSVELNDTTVVLGTVDLTQHGLQTYNDNYFLYSVLGGVAISDGGQATIYYDFNTTGAIETNDVLTVGGTHILPVDSNFYINAVVTVEANQMIDSFCDKFYWKRTA